jgi:hypothetical protein
VDLNTSAGPINWSLMPPIVTVDRVVASRKTRAQPGTDVKSK